MNGEEGITVMGAPAAGAVEVELTDARTALRIARKVLEQDDSCTGPVEIRPGVWQLDQYGGFLELDAEEADLLRRLRASADDGRATCP